MRVTRPAEAPSITCETTLTSLSRVRAFWATLCEDVRTPFVLVPAVASETLRRERLTVTREWEKRLKWLRERNPETAWKATDIRRLSVLAATTARDHLLEHLKAPGGAYTRHQATREKRIEIIEIESAISDSLDDRIFDRASKNWEADRQIIIQSLARGYDIIATNNINTIYHDRLRDWLLNGPGADLDLDTTILEPAQAEEALRFAHNRPIEWAAFAAVRACVTDPNNEKLSLRQVAYFTKEFDERGMGSIRATIDEALDDKNILNAALATVEKHGASEAGRYERRKGLAIAENLSRRTGLPKHNIIESAQALNAPTP